MEELFSVIFGGLAAYAAIVACRRIRAAVTARRERLRARRETLALVDLAREGLRRKYFRAARCLEPVPPSLHSTVASQSTSARELLDAAVDHLSSARRHAEADRLDRAARSLSRAEAMGDRAAAALDERDLWLARSVEDGRTNAFERLGTLKRFCGTISFEILRRAKAGAPISRCGEAIRRLAIAVAGGEALVRRDPAAALEVIERQARRLYELVREARVRYQLWIQVRDFESQLPERAACVRAMAITAARTLAAMTGRLTAEEAARHREAIAAAERRLALVCRQVVESKTTLETPDPVQYQVEIRKVILAETTLARAEADLLLVIELHGACLFAGVRPGGGYDAMVS
jgi:hypothetical protein